MEGLSRWWQSWNEGGSVAQEEDGEAAAAVQREQEESGEDMNATGRVADADGAASGMGKRRSQGALAKGFDFVPQFDNIGQRDAELAFSWEDVTLQIGTKEILRGITGQVRSKKLTAIMGPSGSGKSSLLNVLAGRVRSSKKKKIGGKVLLNAKQVNPRVFRRNIAYVMQEDALMATQTAREALSFSARLRLAKSTSKADRDRIVAELIRALGLEKVQHSYIGSELVRGLSGGEKKRVAIGVELVTNPAILFLDEPTSGLDSFAALAVVNVLHALSRAGCAVLCTIHQPSSAIFNTFDRALVLAAGEVMYNGEVDQVVPVFAERGFVIEENTNPADFVLTVVQSVEPSEFDAFNDDIKVVASMSSGDAEAAIEDATGSDAFLSSSDRIGQLEQASMLARREILDTLRNKAALVARIGVTIFMGVLFALIFKDAGDTTRDLYTPQTHFGALTNLFIAALFGASQPPLLTFPLERVVFLREYSTGSYGTLPYLFSKILVEIPIYLLTSVLQLSVSYSLMALNGPFLALLFEIFLVQLAAASLAYFIGAIVSDAKQAQEFAPLIFVPQLLFLGFFVQINQIPAFLRWVRFIATLKWGLNLGMVTEFGGSRCGDFAPACANILEVNDVEEDEAGLYVAILFGIFCLFRTGSVAGLVWRARNFTN